MLPPEVARIQFVIVPITKKGEEEKVMEYAEKIAGQMERYRTVLDKRDESPGFKFNDWELKGVPVRIEIGPKEADEGKITIAYRTGGKETIPAEEFDPEKAMERVDEEIKRRSAELFNSMLSEAGSIDEIRNRKGLVKVGFCMSEACAEKIKEETGFEVRGTEVGKNEKGTCIVCGKEGVKVWLGRPY